MRPKANCGAAGTHAGLAGASARYAPVITSTMMRNAKLLAAGNEGEEEASSRRKDDEGKRENAGEDDPPGDLFGAMAKYSPARPLARRNVRLRPATSKRVRCAQMRRRIRSMVRRASTESRT